MYKMIIHTSSGGILLNDKNEIFLINKQSRNEWGFPKGTVENGEDLLETAIREIKEETGYTNFTPVSNTPFDSINYSMIHPKNGEEVDKTVYFFIFKLQNDERTITNFMSEEGLEGKWFSVEDAINIVSFEHLKEILGKFKINFREI